jgi:hypothetical protein
MRRTGAPFGLGIDKPKVCPYPAGTDRAEPMKRGDEPGRTYRTLGEGANCTGAVNGPQASSPENRIDKRSDKAGCRL